MDNTTAIKQDIRRLMIENLMLPISPEEISDDQPLFGPGSWAWIRWMPCNWSWRSTKPTGLRLPTLKSRGRSSKCHHHDGCGSQTPGVRQAVSPAPRQFRKPALV